MRARGSPLLPPASLARAEAALSTGGGATPYRAARPGNPLTYLGAPVDGEPPWSHARAQVARVIRAPYSPLTPGGDHAEVQLRTLGALTPSRPRTALTNLARESLTER